MKRWSWLIRYAVVILIALVLASALGATDLFNKTRVLGKGGLTASHLARFLGYGGALAVMWLAAFRTTTLIRDMGARLRIVEVILLPLATLIVVASAHSVLLLVLNLLMDKSVRQIYDWVFIMGIVASAAWLLVTLFNESAGNKRANSAADAAAHTGPAQALSEK